MNLLKLACIVSTFIATSLLAAEDRFIDLGSGEVESDIQGSEYLLRIRGDLKERLGDLNAIIDQAAFKDLESRHLKAIIGEDAKNE